MTLPKQQVTNSPASPGFLPSTPGFVVIDLPTTPIGAVGQRRAVCPHCHLPTYAGRAMHQHCRVLLSNRKRVEEGKALGKFVGEFVWRELVRRGV